MSSVGSISLNHYKCFSSDSRPVGVEVRPLTLFYGYNNSGKSALLRGLCLVFNSLHRQVTEPLDRSLPVFSDQLQLSDLITQERGSRLQINVELVDEARQHSETLAWTLVNLAERSSFVVEGFKVVAPDNHVVISTELNLFDDITGVEREHDYRVDFQGTSIEALPIRFNGLIPEADARTEVGSYFAAWKNMPRNACCWLSSERTSGSRFFSKQPFKGKFLPNGDGFAQALFQSERDVRRSELFQYVSRWFESNLAQKLYIKENTRDFEISLGQIGTPYRINLQDVGQGLQEVLPVLTALHSWRLGMADSIARLAVEEPESHIHPRLHAALGREFCQVATERGAPDILLETHSRNILLSVQLEIARGNIRPEDVILYWIRPDGTGTSRAEPVEFNKLGQPSGNWPPDVFGDDVAQARELIKLQERATG